MAAFRGLWWRLMCVLIPVKERVRRNGAARRPRPREPLPALCWISKLPLPARIIEIPSFCGLLVRLVAVAAMGSKGHGS